MSSPGLSSARSRGEMSSPGSPKQSTNVGTAKQSTNNSPGYSPNTSSPSSPKSPNTRGSSPSSPKSPNTPKIMKKSGTKGSSRAATRAKLDEEKAAAELESSKTKAFDNAFGAFGDPEMEIEKVVRDHNKFKADDELDDVIYAHKTFARFPIF